MFFEKEVFFLPLDKDIYIFHLYLQILSHPGPDRNPVHPKCTGCKGAHVCTSLNEAFYLLMGRLERCKIASPFTILDVNINKRRSLKASVSWKFIKH